MEPVTLKTLADWAGGQLVSGNPGLAVTNLCTDSRTLRRGDLFLALNGENFDGHSFVRQAAEAGAVGALVETVAENLPPDFAIIKVANTLAALQRIATAYRRTLPLKAVVITGSNGKTSTKDLTAAILARRFRVIKTEGNLNNHIGLPLTLLRARADDEIGVFEIGMNHPNEIEPLSKIAQPDVGIITHIGITHIEFMGTRDAIAQEKGMLAEAVPAGGVVILDAEDDYTEAIAARTKARVIRVGADIRASAIRPDDGGSRFTVHASGKSTEMRLPVPGAHMVRNALFATAVGTLFGVSLEECAEGLAQARLTKGRLEQKTIGGIHVLDDSYNANPDSMVAALRTLAEMPVKGRRIAVLGRMGELGAEAARGHRRAGEAAGREKIDCVITVGAEASLIADAAAEAGAGEAIKVFSTEEAAAVLRKIARPGDLVLVKGSRSARIEKVLEGLAS
jgi:UDP-N-acetylmuramoyl-tripeptide--D-alanyl-D-alanine ligase